MQHKTLIYIICAICLYHSSAPAMRTKFLEQAKQNEELSETDGQALIESLEKISQEVEAFLNNEHYREKSQHSIEENFLKKIKNGGSNISHRIICKHLYERYMKPHHIYNNTLSSPSQETSTISILYWGTFDIETWQNTKTAMAQIIFYNLGQEKAIAYLEKATENILEVCLQILFDYQTIKLYPGILVKYQLAYTILKTKLDAYSDI